MLWLAAWSVVSSVTRRHFAELALPESKPHLHKICTVSVIATKSDTCVRGLGRQMASALAPLAGCSKDPWLQVASDYFEKTEKGLQNIFDGQRR